MKTKQYNFFIGQNNTTKKPEYKKAEQIFIKNNVKGFSLTKNVKGFWGGDCEKSFKIEVIANEQNPFNTIKATQIKTELERKLKQFLVLTTISEIEILN